MPSASKDLYRVLGVPAGAPPGEIKDAFRALARKTHPDVNQASPDEFRSVNEAYRVLSDPVKRREYDRSVADSKRPGRPAPARRPAPPVSRPRPSSTPPARSPAPPTHTSTPPDETRKPNTHSASRHRSQRRASPAPVGWAGTGRRLGYRFLPTAATALLLASLTNMAVVAPGGSGSWLPVRVLAAIGVAVFLAAVLRWRRRRAPTPASEPPILLAAATVATAVFPPVVPTLTFLLTAVVALAAYTMWIRALLALPRPADDTQWRSFRRWCTGVRAYYRNGMR